MKKGIVAIVCLTVLMLVFVPSTMKAEGFDPEAISQVSKGIAEWKLMNQDKSETQAEPQVYVSSSLSGMVERGGGKSVKVIKGLSAFSDDVDPILRYEAIEIGYIEIFRNYNLPNPGRIEHTVFSKKIYVNPTQFSNPKYFRDYTPGGLDLNLVIAHEVGHAELSRKIGHPIEVPRTGSLIVNGSIMDKQTYTQRHENYADSFARRFDSIRQDRFAVENSIAQDLKSKGFNVKIYSSYQEYRLDSNTWKSQLNNIPKLPNTRIENWSNGVRMENISALPSSPKLPSMPSITNYPPPDILFSIKSPLDTYKIPMPKIPTYTAPSMPKMPAYTPPSMPSSSTGRRY